MKIDSKLLSGVLGCECEFRCKYGDGFDFNTINSEALFDIENERVILKQRYVKYVNMKRMHVHQYHINLDTFAKLIKKWAYKKGYSIKEVPSHVRVYENEFNKGLFTTGKPKDEEIFDVKKIINAGMFVLGCEEK